MVEGAALEVDYDKLGCQTFRHCAVCCIMMFALVSTQISAHPEPVAGSTRLETQLPVSDTQDTHIMHCYACVTSKSVVPEFRYYQVFTLSTSIMIHTFFDLQLTLRCIELLAQA